MSKPILYSTNCPKCKVLTVKLEKKGIDFDVEGDIEVMKKKGFKHAPQFEVNGEIFDFTGARKLIDEYDPEVRTFEAFVAYKRAE